jgi:hypothetical protein
MLQFRKNNTVIEMMDEFKQLIGSIKNSDELNKITTS